MATDKENTTYALAQPTNYELIGELRYGGNGGAGGAAELRGGSGPTDLVDGRITWDPNLLDGLDSQWVSISLIVLAGTSRQLTWTVGGQTVSYSGPACESIVQLELRNGVGAQAGIAWSDLQIRFLSGGSDVDSWSRASGPTVDLSGNSMPGEKQCVLAVQPSDSADEVRLTGKVRIWAPEGVYLDADSVFGQVLVRDEVA